MHKMFALIAFILCITACTAAARIPATLRDVPYGTDPANTLDVYTSNGLINAPLILLVHGGAWRFGDKDNRAVITNKVKHWLPKGYVVVSINYRMLPDTGPLAQADDVSNAIAYAQTHAAEWGADPEKVILIGHSAGAHLVALVNAQASAGLLNNKIPSAWLGTIALDSAAFDVVAIMQRQDPPALYRRAFGTDPAYWQTSSPIHVLTNTIPPLLAVCSTLRADKPCEQAMQFKQRADSLHSEVTVLPVALSHRDINFEVGKLPEYTAQLDAFIEQIQKNRN
ncbi:alpha/beta hydrolase [Aestuariibacter sp. GS-14]|uniref:alpha/beta hydrolase family protein n=1 Tax=Aestuariibacter sp. GS-14 TaxID=2590670 RepID=UPI0011262C6A|nr:alpha/beta hydrolase [Aestuariibacter sp. GS-14]TPV61117.1 alpha/beta hydrolase [Aestuariibacter sp. GS-14]